MLRKTLPLLPAVLLAALGVPCASAQDAARQANEVVFVSAPDGSLTAAVALRDLDTRQVRTVVPADADALAGAEPALSPDGSRIAYVTKRGSTTGSTAVMVVNRDGTGLRMVAGTPATAGYVTHASPSWSPDGTSILFGSDESSYSWGLHVVRLSDGVKTALAGTEGARQGDWSADGTKVVAALDSTGPTGPLVVVSVDGSGRRELGPAGTMPAWSPDGSTIAYSTTTSSSSFASAQIATVPSAGGAQTLLTVTQPTADRTVAEHPSWTPDGESIVFDLFGFNTDASFGETRRGDLWSVDRLGVRAGRIAATSGDESQADVQGPAPAAVSAGAASTYTPVTPKRVLDTRTGVGAPTGRLGPGGTVELAARGLTTAQGTVPTHASAVVLNVTVTGTTASTDVRAYPSGTPVPGASNVNAGAGQTVPNMVTVRIGDNGAITLRNGAGMVHLIADLAGYYTPDTTGNGFAALAPSRVLDTRSPNVGAPAAKVGHAGFVDLQVTGALPTADGTTVTVPADARAVVLNVTATGATSSTDVRVYPTPAGSSVPEVSNLNVRTGQTTPNLVTVAVGTGGNVRLRNTAGSVNLIADLAGYYAPGATSRFVPVAPARFLDTRSGVGAAPIATTAGGHADLKVAGTRGVPSGASAAVLNLTGTGVTASTDVRAYPSGTSTVPTVSNLNLTAGTTRANLVIVRVGTDGRVRVRNGAGTVNLIGDLAGYMIG